MPLPTITTADFTGFLAISQDRFNDTELQNYIDIFLDEWLQKLVGDAVYIDIRDSAPNPQKYVDLLEGVAYYNDNEQRTVISASLTAVLRHIIYFEYTRKQAQVNTVNGVQEIQNENSKKGSIAQSAFRFNRAVILFNDKIYLFLDQYKSVSRAIVSSVEAPAGVYTITVSDAIYMIEGEAVTIGGIEYTASNVTATTFEIGSGAGESFSGLVTWKPFGDAVYCKQSSLFF